MRRIPNLNGILLIDDDEAINFIHSEIINESNIEVHIEAAVNGREALDCILGIGKYEDGKRPQPYILFLDLNMPILEYLPITKFVLLNSPI